jgi:hypothetical protein
VPAKVSSFPEITSPVSGDFLYVIDGGQSRKVQIGNTLSAAGGVPTSRQILSGAGLTGGGNLSADRTLAVDGTVVRTTRQIIAGTGLTGGGDLSADRTFGLGNVPVANLVNGVTTVRPTSATGTQNNYVPAGGGISGNTGEFWSGASDMTVTGLAGGVIGDLYIFRNVGSHNAFFASNSGLSSAGNKFNNAITSINTPVGPGGSIAYLYDGTTWQLVAHLQGTAISFTPVWTGGTVGNGSITGTYTIAGVTVSVTMTLTWGTTTSSSGAWTFSLPVTAVQTSGFFPGLIMATETGVGNFTGIPVDASGTGVQPYVFANPLANQFDTTHPFTWTNLNVMLLDIVYIGS